MKKEHIKHLIEKYKLGTSSLEEEKILFDNADESENALKLFADFAKGHKKEAPENLNEKLWKSFDEKTRKSNKFKIRMFSAAASILLIISFYISNINQNKMSDTEKQTLLEEAKNMFAEAKQTPTIHQVILESDLIVVYTKP